MSQNWMMHPGKIRIVDREFQLTPDIRELIHESFEKQPVRTVAEAGERIFQLTGLRRGPSQVRKFVKDLGLKFQRVRMVPVPPKKTWTNTSPPKPSFSKPS